MNLINKTTALSTDKPSKRTNIYKRPLRLLLYGTTVPLALGFINMLISYKPQCPDNYTQAQVDRGNCIVGADMSIISIFLAVPFILFFMVWAAVWAAMIWYRSRMAKYN